MQYLRRFDLEASSDVIYSRFFSVLVKKEDVGCDSKSLNLDVTVEEVRGLNVDARRFAKPSACLKLFTLPNTLSRPLNTSETLNLVVIEWPDDWPAVASLMMHEMKLSKQEVHTRTTQSDMQDTGSAQRDI
ncbi:hypothetical protein EYF80_028994 [Liparis tanakae]|uniref:Uncharacterized protein n=1 Tax=Liparis tanakae TaxID=230148 RepID=A0A4Z2H7L5_9TELE|nr:hypothetical protein EYF80_028994 [Liparis tanakae]